MAIVILLLLVGGSTWFLSSRRTRALRKTHPEPVGLWLGFIGTAAGVILGLLVDRGESAKAREDERVAAVRLEKAQAAELMGLGVSAVSELRYELANLRGQCLLTGSDSVDMSRQLRWTPLEPARAVEMLLQSELAARHMSPEGYAQLVNNQSNATSLMRVMNSKQASNAVLAQNLDQLGLLTSVQLHWLEVESAYVAGTLSDSLRHEQGTAWAVAELDGQSGRGTWAALKAEPVRQFHGRIVTPHGTLDSKRNPIFVGP